jgi:hypothetical protein
MSTASTSSAVNHVNDVNRVNDVKTPTPAAFGGVLGGEAACGGVQLFVRLRRWFGCPSACGGVWGGTPPAAAGFSDVIDVIDAVDVIDSGRG